MLDSVISALKGNSSVKTLSICGVLNLRSLTRALPGIQGIEYLHVAPTCDEAVSSVLRSLWAHPRIQAVRIKCLHRLLAESQTSMMNEILQMVQCNTVVHTIDLRDDHEDEEFFQNFILPRLDMNHSCFEDQRQALTRADPSIRSQLLGRELHVARYNLELLFRFSLGECLPAFVRLDEDGPIILTGRKRKAPP